MGIVHETLPEMAMEIDDVPLQISAPETIEEPPILLNAAGRVARKRRPTWKILERLPAPPAPIPDVAIPDVQVEISSSDASAIPPSPLVPPNPVFTVQNEFGMYREFPSLPTHNPDDNLTISNLADTLPPPTVVDAPIPISRLSVPTPVPSGPDNSLNGPFGNSSIFGLLNWMWTGSAMKSLGECIKLFQFLQSDSFCKEDIMGVDVVKETARLDEYMGFQSSRSNGSLSLTPPKDGWRESDVSIQVPDGEKHAEDDSIPTFVVPGLHHRSITAVIRSVFEDPASYCFHYTPFKSLWKSSKTAPAQRVYDDIYCSDAMIEAHTNLQQSPPEQECKLERVVASLMFWSDSTHLANFGTASLWPLYLFFGNQAKSLRGKPSTASCHHIAYIPKV